MTDKGNLLRSNFLGIEIGSPCLVASSVLTGDIERISLAERHGAGGISTKMALLEVPFVSKADIIVRPRGLGYIASGDKRLHIDAACELVSQAKRNTNMMIIANLLAPADDLAAWQRLAERLEEAGADALELDISCPNMPKNVVRIQPGVPLGTCVAQFPDASRSVTHAVKSVVNIPVICKLTFHVVNIAEIARACKDGGADAVTAINSLRAAPTLDIWNRGRPTYATMEQHSLGAIGGPAIFPIACRSVAEIAREVDIPVIGCGGITTWQDAVEMMLWGASALQLCNSVMLSGFEVIDKINAGIERYMAEQGYTSTKDFVGLALEHVVPPNQVVYRRMRISIDENECNLCKRCLAPGICTALSLETDRIDVDDDKCINCGVCMQVCPKRAIQAVYHG